LKEVVCVLTAQHVPEYLTFMEVMQQADVQLYT
jgi:hypothetical protein